MHTDAGAGSLAERAANAFRAYRDGDPTGMSTLVDEVTPLLWSVARQQRLTHQAAEDVVQNTWLKLVEHSAQIADPQSVLKWLITTTRRDSWTASSRGRREEPATYADVRDQESDDTTPSPETSVLAEVDDRLVWQHFASLPERCKSLLRVIAFAERPDYVLPVERYASLLHRLGYARQHVRLQVYGHVLPESGDVVEWVRGALLTHYEALLGNRYAEYLDLYRKRLLGAIGNERPYFYTYKRVLMWGSF